MISSASLSAAVVAVGFAVLAYGVGSLLQAMAARRDPRGGASALLLSPLVLGGLALDVLGFLAGAVALHDLPLFFVQGATSTSILVTALLASVVLRERPDRHEALAMPLVLAGLVTLAFAAQPGVASAPPGWLSGALAVCAPLFGAGGWWCTRHPRRSTGLGLAVLAGLSYGCAGLAARATSSPDDGTAGRLALVAVVVVHALQGVVLVTVAMRRAPVNTVTSVLFATEAVGPAAFGLLVLGDRVAEGSAWAAIAGFCCLVGATVLLTREPRSPAGSAPHASGWPRVDLLPAGPPTGSAPTTPLPTAVRPPVPEPRSASRPGGRHRAPASPSALGALVARPGRGRGQTLSSSEKSKVSSSSTAAASKIERPARSVSRSSWPERGA